MKIIYYLHLGLGLVGPLFIATRPPLLLDVYAALAPLHLADFLFPCGLPFHIAVKRTLRWFPCTEASYSSRFPKNVRASALTGVDDRR